MSVNGGPASRRGLSPTDLGGAPPSVKLLAFARELLICQIIYLFSQHFYKI